jgi:hypothetical protein
MLPMIRVNPNPAAAAGWKGGGDISALLARQLTLGGPGGAAAAAAARPVGAAAAGPRAGRPGRTGDPAAAARQEAASAL